MRILADFLGQTINLKQWTLNDNCPPEILIPLRKKMSVYEPDEPSSESLTKILVFRLQDRSSELAFYLFEGYKD